MARSNTEQAPEGERGIRLFELRATYGFVRLVLAVTETVNGPGQVGLAGS